MTGRQKPEKEKNQNIHVAVRCRPVNSIEKKQGSCSILQCDKVKKEVVVKERPGINPYTKTYVFDHVFPPDSQQIDVYKTVVKPVVEEVLTGYNCTIFAYGQTGTGKTFTMEGERGSDPGMTWEEDPLCGIIPRALHQIFQDLQKQPDVEFSVRVSFLELYNEELFDLLGSSVDPLRLRIYEDNTKKGSVIISGLEEVVVRTKDEVFEILQRGTAKRQTAATLMNAVSSRSHSVFSVTIHIKENTVDGEELLKTGKLYLVDLAGSENIGRSGAVDKRAREAGNINQSLLTLGRVITALVEHAPHVPYRESKLTRLLQDSLGGRTKTSIIATISPAACNLEETLSTLDYAFRAKNITNRPEVNQKLTKKALLREYNEEIERLRRDLQACREKNGIYVAEDNYMSMQNKIAQQGDEIQEMEDKITALTEEMKSLSDMFTETKEELILTTERLTETTENLATTTENLKQTTQELHVTQQDRDEQKFLVEEHVKNEGSLYSEAEELLSTAANSINHVGGLHDKIDRKKAVEEHNLVASQTVGKSMHDQITSLQDFLVKLQVQTSELKKEASDQIDELSQQYKKEVNSITKDLNDFMGIVDTEIAEIIKQQKNVEKINTEWAVSFQKKYNTLKENAVALFETSQQECCGQIQEAKRAFSKQKTHMTELVSSLASQREKTFEAISDFQRNIIKQMGELLDRSQKHNSELKAQNAQMKAVIKSYEWEDEELEKKMSVLRQERKEKNKILLQKANSHLDEQDKKNDDFSVVIDSAQKDIQDLVNTEVTTLKVQVKGDNEDNLSGITSAVETLDFADSFCNELNTHTGKTTEATKQAWTDAMHHVTQCLEHHSSQQASFYQTHNDTSKRFSEKASNHVSSSKRMIEENDIKFNLLSETLSTHNDTLHKALSDGFAQQNNSLDAALQTVQEFVTKEIRKDLPTGLTPQRCEYTYPRNLTKTEPHQTLLERFRANHILQQGDMSGLKAEQNIMVSECQGSTEDLRGSLGNLSDAGSDKSAVSFASTSGISCSSTRSKVSEVDCGKENRSNTMKPPRTTGTKKIKAVPPKTPTRSRTPSASKTPGKTRAEPKQQGPSVTHTSRSRLPLRPNNP